jgi:steroid delta-isomerase-like uncharacterized protein
MSEENKAAARRFYDAWHGGDLDSLDDLIAQDVVDHDPYSPHASEGLEGVKKLIAMYREAFPDVRFTIEDQVAEGDKVVTRWTATGTHEGQLMGVEPTGKTSTITGIGIDRFEDGKIVEVWGNWDTLALMQDIGAIPEAQPAQA